MAATISTNNGLFKGKMLDYYYVRRAESAIGGDQFILARAAFGTSSLVTQSSTQNGWVIADIPPDFKKSDLHSRFAECPLVLSLSGANINISATLSDSDLADDAPHNLNTMILLDNKGEAVAVLCCQQDTVYRGKVFQAMMTIEQRAS